MNFVHHRKYVLEFDVWDPMKNEVDKEMDAVVLHVKKTLSHCGNVRLGLEVEQRV